MAKFDSLLNQIHDATSTGALAADENGHIKILNNRTFELPEGFETIIAYAGDVNSQVVTFDCPARIEGHDLSKCSNKKLRWYNTASKNEGSSTLTATLKEDILELGWEAPAEAFTMAGDLKISITFSDYVDGKLVFSWNTSALTSLQVGETLDEVSDLINKEEFVEHMPAKDEILLINTDTREIVEPKGYNRVLCNYGDARTSVVYFQVKRYVRGIDLLAEDTYFSIYWKIYDNELEERSEQGVDKSQQYLYAIELDGRDSEGLVNIVWIPSPNITANELRYAGPITIQLEVASSGGRVWRTSSYNSLLIKESPFTIKTGDWPVEEGVHYDYVIDAAAMDPEKDVVYLGGLVKLRSCTPLKPISLHKNEIVIEYTADGEYVGAKVGIVDNQDSRHAPYIAYNPSTAFEINGGNSLVE